MWYFYHQESLKQTTPLVLSPSNVSELSVEVVENKEGWVETILAILKATLLVSRLEFKTIGSQILKRGTLLFYVDKTYKVDSKMHITFHIFSVEQKSDDHNPQLISCCLREYSNKTTKIRTGN